VGARCAACKIGLESRSRRLRAASVAGLGIQVAAQCSRKNMRFGATLPTFCDVRAVAEFRASVKIIHNRWTVR